TICNPLTPMAPGSVGAVVAAPYVLAGIGFTSAGISAGSFAASMMSSAAIANGGGVAAGSLVAILQSAGAAGLTAGASAAVAGAGAAAGAAVAGTAGALTVKGEEEDKDTKERRKKRNRPCVVSASKRCPRNRGQRKADQKRPATV
uniref:Uncharacterized protein n=1 Tax=Myripristis murdjan TaxID=586833 RepID=A0A667WHW9_9TELE